MCYSRGWSVGNTTVVMSSLNLEFARVGHHRLELNSVDQGLSQSNILDGRIVKPIHVIPDCNRTAGALSERQEPQE